MQSVAATAARFRAVSPAAGTGELERLFREHHGQVFRAAYRITGSVTDAEDVLQTIFLRLASNAGLGARSGVSAFEARRRKIV